MQLLSILLSKAWQVRGALLSLKKLSYFFGYCIVTTVYQKYLEPSFYCSYYG